MIGQYVVGRGGLIQESEEKDKGISDFLKQFYTTNYFWSIWRLKDQFPHNFLGDKPRKLPGLSKEAISNSVHLYLRVSQVSILWIKKSW